MTSAQSCAKRSPIACAMTAEGYELPVIDVTNPAFRVADNADALSALRLAYDAWRRRDRWIPKPLMQLLLKFAARRSRLLRALLEPDGPTLGGLTTYVLKLGADNLPPPYGSPLDRRVAASPPIMALRLRLQQTAQLLAEGLKAPLKERPDAAVHFVNIGGGPAMDCVNALILLKRATPELLHRPIVIHVFDRDAGGPRFGANALAVLGAEGGALAGLAVSLRHVFYDWEDPAPLRAFITALAEQATIIAASSEGALFAYGSDEAIIANLKALCANGRGACVVAGSINCADAYGRATIRNSPFKLVLRTLEEFNALAAPAGYFVAQSKSALFSEQLLLERR